MITNDFTEITIKLGGKCNLACPHCHCNIPEYEFNPKLLDWIRSQPVYRIKFGGGEPFLYFDTIRKIVLNLGDAYNYRIVTNGTLLTERNIDFCNDHDITIVQSYDGESSARDVSISPKWELLRFARKCAFSVYTSGSKNSFEIQDDVHNRIKRYVIKRVSDGGAVFPQFLHETENSSAVETKESIKEYLKTTAQRVELELIGYLQTGDLSDKRALSKAIQKWLEPKNYKYGVACCNNRHITVTLDGRFMICPYKDEYCGDIEHGINIKYLESRIPERCRRCSIFKICSNTCILNNTVHECMIAKKMYQHLKKLEEKYQINLVELAPKH